MQNNKIDFNSKEFLYLPSHIKDKFQSLAGFRQEVNLPSINNPDNCSTVALLVINNNYFWGINKRTAGLSSETLKAVQMILKDEHDVSAHMTVLGHAEADAIIDAFNHNMNAHHADLYVDRKLCGFCAGRNLNGGSLRRLLPLLSLKIMDVYAPDNEGKITKVVLTPVSTFHDRTFSIADIYPGRKVKNPAGVFKKLY